MHRDKGFDSRTNTSACEDCAVLFVQVLEVALQISPPLTSLHLVLQLEI